MLFIFISEYSVHVYCFRSIPIKVLNIKDIISLMHSQSNASCQRFARNFVQTRLGGEYF